MYVGYMLSGCVCYGSIRDSLVKYTIVPVVPSVLNPLQYIGHKTALISLSLKVFSIILGINSVLIMMAVLFV